MRTQPLHALARTDVARVSARAATAAALRDETEELWRAAESQEEKAAIIARYRGQLNRI